MTLSSHQAELEKMIKSFRVSDLQTLLIYVGKNKAGKKSELQARALELVRHVGPNATSIQMKIRELHKSRYAQTHGHTEPPEMYPPDMYSHGYNDPVGSHKAPMGSGVLPSNFMQPYNQLRANPAMNLMPQYPVNPDVQFKDLPFFDVLNELLKPTSLVPIRNDGIVQEKELIFYLGPQDIRELDSHTDVQVQFRIGCLENNQEQDDEFPSSVCIKVNNKVSPLPNPIPTNKPGVEAKRPKRPLDITNLIKRSSSEPQILCISWAATNNFKPYVTAVFLVRKQTSDVLIKRLKDIGVRNPDHTTAMIKEKLNTGDSEIATMSLRGSLTCPLGKIKMALPCRALTCTHLQCFDAALYIQMNEKKPKWICPVCDKPAVFKSLAIDGLFLDITRKVPSECTEVQFHDNGSWTPVMPIKKVPEIKEVVPVMKVEVPKPKKVVEVVSLDSDSDTEDSWPIQPPKKKPCKPIGVINSVSLVDNPETSITIEPVTKSYDILQPCSSKSVLSASKVSALPTAEKSASQNSSSFPLFFEPTAYSPQSPANQSSASSTFQEPVDILNNSSSTAGQCYDFDLYSLMQQPTENLQDTFQFQDATSEETIVSDDAPDIISID